MFNKFKKWLRELFTSIPKEEMDEAVKYFKDAAKKNPYKEDK